MSAPSLDTSPPNYRIETTRLSLRPLAAQDQEFLYSLYNNAEVMQHISSGVRSRATTSAHLQNFVHHWREHGFGMFLITEKSTSQPVGYSGLRYLENSSEIELGF